MKLVLLFIITLTPFLGAQEKFEKETEIKFSEVPNEALEFIEKTGVQSRITWYRELSLDGISFEAKFKRAKRLYSVEFDSLGTVQDVEVLVSWKKLPTGIKSTVSSWLDDHYVKWKIFRLQRQYSGSPQQLLSYIKGAGTIPDSQISYEIEIRVKTKHKYEMREFLFDASGKLKSNRLILLENTDNLEF